MPAKRHNSNAAIHWMTSCRPLIQNETAEQLQAHLEHWRSLFPGVDTDELLCDLVGYAANSDWLLIRNQRQYDEAMHELHQTDISLWTPENHEKFQLRERYLTTAQRRLSRERTHVLGYLRDTRSQPHLC